MTRRLQLRIMGTFVLLLLLFVGFFVYDKLINSADLLPSKNELVKSLTYSKSDKLAIFEIRWKKPMKIASVKDINNYYIEHVVPVKGKWMTAMNGKKCTLDFAQHVPDIRDPEKKTKVTQLTVRIDPKEAVDDYYRVRVRNVVDKENNRLEHIEYGVTQVSGFANFAKK